ncbi:hypothetical protein [Paenibacillus abyssi]|uniref:Uncharacterized protein n=1 Tax=Paenibacillus abyssi TaxID=1340531 RepID=A0A917G434_9BACL|nr:hypothetical protein [Paenibacillus abyssi]GGG21606.1 hypothetical protein GCM10010916_42900 [Paenibacillus abyssi]
MKKIWKIIWISLGSLVLLISIAGFILYLNIRSIDLDDIKNRQLAKTEQTEQTEGQSSEDEELPSVLEGAVGKADQLADKPVESQDALDAAAILLNSELSFKEMYYLMGKSTDNLSTEEKQRIRDLLLEKLTPEEIEALRSITTDYGKGLVILDPNYPIEAVGVKDDAQRQRIIEQANKDKQADTEMEPQPAVQKAEGTDSDVSLEQSTTAAEKQDTSASEGNVQLAKKYEAELSRIKASCIQDAGAMLNKVLSSIDQMDNNAKAGSTQQQLLQQIAAAEAQCDGQFQSLLARAKSEYAEQGASFAISATWAQQYEATKESIRAQAVSRISEKLQANG